MAAPNRIVCITRHASVVYKPVAKMATTASDENFYRRRLDRTPEKLEFHALPDQDKKLISSLREAVTGAHSKMSRMKDEVEDK